jgi:hypothetical protein
MVRADHLTDFVRVNVIKEVIKSRCKFLVILKIQGHNIQCLVSCCVNNF